ncbi:MAG: ABC transporter substrate-binding protein [Caldilineaceae bacterium]|nr:ABC transporter substrate-binding protein [Caldilineaceae bacterium]
MTLVPMKKVLPLLFAIMIGAGCAAPAAPAPAADAPVDTPPTAQTLILAIGGEAEEGYDPTLGWGRYGAPLFQSTLLRRDEGLNLVNDLAESYTVSEDRLVWTVKIRADVQFSDGTPLTAEDVAFTYTKAAESGGLTDVTVLESATAIDDYTVELRLKQPQSTFVNRLVTLGIVPAATYDENYGQNPIGSGPYTLLQWDKGQQLIVEANPLYYGDKPAIERVVFLFLEEDAAFAAAKAGEVQVVSVPQSLAIQQLPGMRLVDVASVDNRGMLFPFVPDTGEQTASGYAIGNNVTADQAIRQAINYVVDRAALVEGVLEGYGSPAFGPVSGLPWEEPTAVIADADLATAQQLLSEGGWADDDGDGIVEKDGLRAEFTLIYPASDSTRQALALSVADMIKPAGIQVNVEGKSWDEIEKLMHSNAILFGWGSHDQNEMWNLYHSSMRGVEYYNTGYYANEQVDSYLDLAMGAASEAEAIAFWQAAQWDQKADGFTTKGDAAWAWLVNLDHTYFVSECLDIGQPQVEPHGHGWPLTANLTTWQWTCP